MGRKAIDLRYGMNPHQKRARAFSAEALPFEVRNGRPGFINLLDALNSWQLVSELSHATNLPAAAAFKHVSPAGAAVAVPLSETLAAAYQVPFHGLTPLATAYARARGADRVSAFGDWVALSETVDESTARMLAREVSDGVIAPAFEPAALDLLAKKKAGTYCVIEMDPSYKPPTDEARQVFGVTLEQARNDAHIDQVLDAAVAAAKLSLPAAVRRDALVALAALKYTQSNAMVLSLDGQTIGIGAGQQSRIECTRLACAKADAWWLRQHPRALALPMRPVLSRSERDNAFDGFVRDDLTAQELDIWQGHFVSAPTRFTARERTAWLAELGAVVLGSDAYIPFRDNIDRAAASGVRYVIQTGGSRDDDKVRASAVGYGMQMITTGVRLFHH